MTTSTRELVLAKLTKRKKALELMRKHGFTAIAHPSNDLEHATLDRVISFIANGGQFDLSQKGFLNCVRGRVVCKLAA